MSPSLSEDELLAAEERRANTYKLLSECFHPPDEELLTLLAGAVERPLAVEGLVAAVPDDVESLRVDHAKLFVGPFELLAPPYESVYLDDPERVMTESTREVLAAYREEGLDVGLDEPADHVAAELEFLYVLVGTELEALGEPDPEPEVAADYLRRQHAFLESHLGRWIGAFADEVGEHARTEFYRTLARETAAFVEADARWLSNRIERFDAEEIDVHRVLSGGERP